MRWAISLTLLLASCIPSGDRKPTPIARDLPAPFQETRLCLADLRSEDVRFTALPDRHFGNGCSAVGAVQLLDIGTPVANLGAMTCPLALRFARWTREAVQPAANAWLGSRVVRIESFGTYSCRSVNSRPGARLSEHGRANAVDVGVFVLADGRRIAVLEGWNGRDEDVRRFLRAVHSAGCRRFGIVLGPDSDAFHRDHLHFDMGQGPYCR
ncbi:MAG TPA: extensin family protein [Allosphingosinicella sp.]|nr:extensin family protein [Allosphingosinicella sp.]